MTTLALLAFVGAAIYIVGAVFSLTPANRYVLGGKAGAGPFASYNPGSGAINIRGIKSIGNNLNLSWIKDAGDGDISPTTVVNDFVDPTVDILTTDAFALYTTALAAIGTLITNWPDSTNGMAAGGGGKIITLSNAFIQTENRNAPYRQFATQNLSFACFSSDGQTVALAITAA